MNIDWNAISAGATAFATILAIIALAWQIKTTRFSMGVDILLKMNDKFHSEIMVNYRKIAAQALMDKSEIYVGIDTVLDFFEGIGFLLRKGAINKEMVYNEFSYWSVYYWEACKEYIEETWRLDRSYWPNYKYLVKEMSKMNEFFGSPHPTEKEIKQFLLNEISEGTKPIITSSPTSSLTAADLFSDQSPK